MLKAKLSANLMSLGALDFGLIVDGAVIIAENSLRHLAERQRELGRVLSLDERLETVTTSAKEMIQPTVYGQAIIILVYVPLLTFTGVEGKTFLPMAMTVIIALVTAFVLSLTFVPAMIAIAVTGRVQEKENLFVRGLKALYRPALARAIRSPVPVIAAAILLFVGRHPYCSRALARSSRRPSTRRTSSWRSSEFRARRFRSRRPCSSPTRLWLSRFPQVAFVFSRTGTPDLAADPMPPSASDTYIILKPRDQWPDPDLSKDDLIQRTGYRSIEAARQQVRFLAADPDALQRADRRRAGGPGGQGLRRRVRADAACGRSECRHPRGVEGRRRQGRGGDGPAVPGDQDRQGRDRAPRLEPFGRSGCHRHCHRRTRSRPGVRGRPPLPDHRASARCGAQRHRNAGKSAGDAAASRRPGQDR